MAEISVIVPAYNAEKYLENTIKSILNQSFEDFEVILVDDGSVDKTPEIMAAYAAQDKRVRVISQPNKKLPGARNAGMDAAVGKYLYFADADDILHPQILAFLYQACEKEQADFACCDFVAVEENQLPEMPVYDKDVSGEIIYKPLEFMCGNRKKINNNVWTKLYRASALAGLRFADNQGVEDLYFNILAMRKFSKGVFVPLVLYYYILSPGSITRGDFKMEKLDVHMDCYKQLQKDFENEQFLWLLIKRQIVNRSFYGMAKAVSELKNKKNKQKLKAAWRPQIREFKKAGIIGTEGLSLRKRFKLFLFMLF